MKLYTPDNSTPDSILFVDGPSIFIGGTIDNGDSKDWQKYVIEKLSDTDLNIFSPRTKVWNSDLPMDPTPGTKFYNQVSWEFNAQDMCEILLYNFEANSKSPITLMELGMYSEYNYSEKNIFVVCPKEFWRCGNVTMLCDRCGITMFDTIDDVINAILERTSGVYV